MSGKNLIDIFLLALGSLLIAIAFDKSQLMAGIFLIALGFYKIDKKD